MSENIFASYPSRQLNNLSSFPEEWFKNILSLWMVFTIIYILDCLCLSYYWVPRVYFYSQGTQNCKCLLIQKLVFKTSLAKITHKSLLNFQFSTSAFSKAFFKENKYTIKWCDNMCYCKWIRLFWFPVFYIWRGVTTVFFLIFLTRMWIAKSIKIRKPLIQTGGWVSTR